MTTNDPNAPAAEAGGFPDALRWQLHALRQDMPPARDLWPDIAPRLAPPRRLPGTPTRTPWLALAASLLFLNNTIRTEDAAAVSIAMHLVYFAPAIVFGLYYFVRGDISIERFRILLSSDKAVGEIESDAPSLK